LKKYIRPLCTFLLLIFFLAWQAVPVFAQLQLPGRSDGTTKYDSQVYFENLDVVSSDDSAEQLVNTVRALVNALKFLLFPLLAGLIVYIGVRIIFSNGNEDEIKKYAGYFVYVLIGVAFIVVAEKVSLLFTLGGTDTTSSFLSDSEYQLAGNTFGQVLRSFVTFARYLLGGIAVFFSVKSGALVIFANGDEAEVTKQKEVFMWGFVGFIVIMASTTLVDNVIFPVDQNTGAIAPSVSEGVGLIVSLVNLLLGLLGGIAVISLVAGGVMYAASAGNTDRSGKAGKIIYGSLIGLIIAYSSYTIVSEFIPQHKTVGISAPDFNSGQGVLEGSLP
jgi:hypothetical protein